MEQEGNRSFGDGRGGDSTARTFAAFGTRLRIGGFAACDLTSRDSSARARSSLGSKVCRSRGGGCQQLSTPRALGVTGKTDSRDGPCGRGRAGTSPAPTNVDIGTAVRLML